jgi:hypothetical protein
MEIILNFTTYAFSNKVIGKFWENTNYYWCSQIIQTQFDNPIVVPAGVERILVTVSKFKILYDPTVAEIVAGTTVDTGESLYYGCGTQRTTTAKPCIPVRKFFINVIQNAR